MLSINGIGYFQECYISKLGDEHRTEKVYTVKQIYSAHLVLCREKVSRPLNSISCIQFHVSHWNEWLVYHSLIYHSFKSHKNSCSNFMVSKQSNFLNRNFCTEMLV